MDREQITFLNDGIFGTGARSNRTYADGHDWIGAIEERENAYLEAVNRLLREIGDIYCSAPDGSMIIDFDRHLYAEAEKRGYVSALDIETAFLPALRRITAAAIPGLKEMKNGAHGYDATVLLETYGTLAGQFPFFDAKGSLLRFVSQLRRDTTKLTPEHAFNVLLRKITDQLDLAEDGGQPMSTEQITAMHTMADDVWEELDSFARYETSLGERADQTRQRLANLTAGRGLEP